MSDARTIFRRTLAAMISAAVVTHCALAAPRVDRDVPDYDFQWVTIGAPGNPNFKGEKWMNVSGHGRVNYRYRISAMEVTTAQWMEFLNTIAPLSPNPLSWGRPSLWGAEDVFTAPPGVYQLRTDWGPDPAIAPVYGVSWREAAMYCNWLHNGKQASFQSVLDGAYDASTFANGPGGTFTDQPTRSPGARFWIPSLSEWVKAAHYDPNRYDEGEGGYWDYAHSSDEPPVPGMPGAGETMAGWNGGATAYPAWAVPLGAYPDVRSPWGLLDASGGASEWTEYIFFPGYHTARGFDGAPVLGQSPEWDYIGFTGGISPGGGAGRLGLRVASAIPTPSTLLGVIPAVAYAGLFRRREPCSSGNC